MTNAMAVKTDQEVFDAVFNSPDNIGSSEYRAIYDVCKDVMDEWTDPESSVLDHVYAILEEFEGYASALRQALDDAADGND